ncbi:MAG: hypothetical protein Q9M28_00025, partial [Mariprofundaceae bacterium]|nr:hypothetical protein [Mariprofundaceae bacterium]
RWPCETVKASREAYKRFQNENVWNWVEYYFDEQQKKQLYSALQTKKTRVSNVHKKRVVSLTLDSDEFFRLNALTSSDSKFKTVADVIKHNLHKIRNND